MSGGFGVIIGVADIIDPESGGSPCDDGGWCGDMGNDFEVGVREWQMMYDEKELIPCEGLKEKVWATEPIFCGNLGEDDIRILCNNLLKIVDGSDPEAEPLYIDLSSCGAKVVTDGKNVKIYSGCKEQTGTCEGA